MIFLASNNSQHQTIALLSHRQQIKLYYFQISQNTKSNHSLDLNKAHGHDGVSVRMLKFSWQSIIKRFLIIFGKCLKLGTFPDDWKKGNVVPVHKQNYKLIVNNYRPVFLPHICSKVLKKLICDAIFEIMIENNFLRSTQSGFKPKYSYANQLISIAHSIFSAFDAILL